MHDYYPANQFLGISITDIDKLFAKATPLCDKAMQSKYAPVITPLGATPKANPAPRIRYALRRTSAHTKTSLIGVDEVFGGFFLAGKEPKDATLFLSVTDAIAALTKRNKVVTGYGMENWANERFTIVKVLVTETPGTRIVREAKEAELVTCWAIRVNGAWYWAGSCKSGNYARTAQAARSFSTESEAVQFATTSNLTGICYKLEFVKLTTFIEPSITTYEVVEL